MRVGIVAAMKPEMEEILNEMEDLESVRIFGSEFHRGYIGNVEVVLTESGMGKVNAAIATTILIREFECSFIINTGIAGGTKPLKHRDIIIAESLAYHDVDATIFGYKYGQVPRMPAEYLVNVENIIMIKSVLNKIGIKWLPDNDKKIKEEITEENKIRKQIEILNRVKTYLLKYDGNKLPNKEELNKEFIKELRF